jgi:anti-anti-sigma factor
VALSTKTHFWDDVIILRCVGRLVAGVETITFRQGVEKLLSARHKVVVNLTEVDHIDSTGLATLAYFSKWNKQNRDPKSGTRLVSSGMYLTELLRRTSMDTVLTVYASEEDAIASFPKTDHQRRDDKAERRRRSIS